MAVATRSCATGFFAAVSGRRTRSPPVHDKTPQQHFSWTLAPEAQAQTAHPSAGAAAPPVQRSVQRFGVCRSRGSSPRGYPILERICEFDEGATQDPRGTPCFQDITQKPRIPAGDVNSRTDVDEQDEIGHMTSPAAATSEKICDGHPAASAPQAPTKEEDNKGTSGKRQATLDGWMELPARQTSCRITPGSPPGKEQEATPEVVVTGEEASFRWRALQKRLPSPEPFVSPAASMRQTPPRDEHGTEAVAKRQAALEDKVKEQEAVISELKSKLEAAVWHLAASAPQGRDTEVPQATEQSTDIYCGYAGPRHCPTSSPQPSTVARKQDMVSMASCSAPSGGTLGSTANLNAQSLTRKSSAGFNVEAKLGDQALTQRWGLGSVLEAKLGTQSFTRPLSTRSTINCVPGHSSPASGSRGLFNNGAKISVDIPEVQRVQAILLTTPTPLRLCKQGPALKSRTGGQASPNVGTQQHISSHPSLVLPLGESTISHPGIGHSAPTMVEVVPVEQRNYPMWFPDEEI